MTREEVIRELKQFSGTTRLRLSANFWEALNRAIKLLEQEPILDKIRAEIEETYMNITYQENKDRHATWGLRKALEIIDKYKAESEEIQ